MESQERLFLRVFKVPPEQDKEQKTYKLLDRDTRCKKQAKIACNSLLSTQKLSS